MKKKGIATSAHEVLRLRLIEEYVKKGTAPDVLSSLETQNRDGSWSHVKYDDTSQMSWKASAHLGLLYNMAIAYHSPSHAPYRDPRILQGIEKGLALWYQRKPTSTNYWYRVIGQQLTLGPILLLMQEEIKANLVDTGVGYLYDVLDVPSPYGPDSKRTFPASAWTGANLIWIAQETIWRGLLKQDETDIRKGLGYIKSEIEIVTREGIQPDLSFHQHGPQLYNGGYGLSYIHDVCQWVERVEQTEFAFEKDEIDILTALLLDGNRWMVRGTHMDFSVQGREASRMGTGEKARNLLTACSILARNNPDRAKEIEEMQKSIYGEGPLSSITGNKYFWRSDYMVQQRQEYFASVKMVSDRTTGTEMVNNENIKGFWLPFGLTCILQRGDEYREIWPIWDWARLPGVTSPYRVVPIRTEPENRNGYVFSKEKFVGGASDGMHGVAAMAIGETTTSWAWVNESLSKTAAKKSWFFFDDEFVALGAGISSTDEASVGTTLNQCFLRGNVLTQAGEIKPGDHVSVQAKWVLHDGIGYLFPETTAVNVKAGSRSGSWNSISATYAKEEIAGNLFTLWVDHGVQPHDARYQYLVMPGTDARAVEAYSASPPVQVLSNCSMLQAVRHEGLGLSGIVFYAPGRIDIRQGLGLSLDTPCIILVRENGDRLQVYVSEPTGEADSIAVTLSTPNSKAELVFELPKEGMAGSTISKEVCIQ